MTKMNLYTITRYDNMKLKKIMIWKYEDQKKYSSRLVLLGPLDMSPCNKLKIEIVNITLKQKLPTLPKQPLITDSNALGKNECPSKIHTHIYTYIYIILYIYTFIYIPLIIIYIYIYICPSGSLKSCD